MSSVKQSTYRPARRGFGGRLTGILLVVLGAALVAGSGYTVHTLLERVQAVAPPKMAPAVVMARAVAERQPIPRDAVRVDQLPVETIAASVVTRLEEVDGKLAAVGLLPGEILYRHRLQDRGTEPGLAAHLQPHEVAVSFPAAGIAAVGGILPGDRVDVVVTMKRPSATGQSPQDFVTTAALRDLRILSVARIAPGTPQGAVPSRTGSLAEVGGVAAGTGQVVFAAGYEDALFLKSLKDSRDVSLDLVLRPIGQVDLSPAPGLTLVEGFRQRGIALD